MTLNIDTGICLMRIKLKDTFKNIKLQTHAYTNAFPIVSPKVR